MGQGFADHPADERIRVGQGVVQLGDVLRDELGVAAQGVGGESAIGLVRLLQGQREGLANGGEPRGLGIPAEGSDRLVADTEVKIPGRPQDRGPSAARRRGRSPAR